MKPTSTLRTLSLFAAIAGISFIINACHKNTTTDKKSTPTINVSGKLMPRGQVLFATNATGSAYLWNFGDGSISSVTAPDHIYSAVGTYSVTVAVDGSVVAASTSVNITSGANIFQGSHNWSNGQYRQIEYGGRDTGWALNDTTFTITRVNDSTINVWGTNIFYTSSRNSFYDPAASYPFEAPEVWYDRDTIHFMYNKAYGHYLTTITTYQTPI